MFQGDFSHELNDRKSQIPRVNALKYRVVEMEFRQIDSPLSLETSRSHTCFCHAPTVETAENMAVLNVDYIAWIITVC